MHPLLVHFPTALLPMELVLSAIGYFRNDPSFAMAGFYCLLGGVLLGAAAIVTGLVELITLPRTDKKALAAGIYHGFLNGTVILVFAVLAYRGWEAYPGALETSMGALVFKTVLILTLFFGNYLGGELVYKYFVGINFKNSPHENN